MLKYHDFYGDMLADSYMRTVSKVKKLLEENKLVKGKDMLHKLEESMEVTMVMGDLYDAKVKVH